MIGFFLDNHRFLMYILIVNPWFFLQGFYLLYKRSAILMKNRYFTNENIENQSCRFMESVKEVQRHGDGLFQPFQSALLICDMQGFFLDERSHAFIPSASAIVTPLRVRLRPFRASPTVCGYCPVIKLALVGQHLAQL